MKRLMIGLAIMAFVWAVQAQTAEVGALKENAPQLVKNCLDCHSQESPEQQNM